MSYKKVINQVSKEFDKPKEVIDFVYKYYWGFIKNIISQLNLKKDLSKQEFSNLKTNFNIPSLGKLYVTYDGYLKNKTKYKYGNKKN